MVILTIKHIYREITMKFKYYSEACLFISRYANNFPPETEFTLSKEHCDFLEYKEEGGEPF